MEAHLIFEGLAYLTAAFALVQVLYYWVVFSRFAFYKPKSNNTTTLPPVSVIICAKNEAKNLPVFLPSILTQNYPDYEVVVINNASWDNTKEILEEMQKTYPHLKIVTLKEELKYREGKKLGLTLGIKAAKNEVLLFTDADCKPLSDQWIRNMAANYNDKTEIVLGYSPYTKTNGLVNLIIRFETFYTALQYFGFALFGGAYMGVGRNLSYRKETFFRVKGFATHTHIISGDDDLFINAAATATNVAIEVSPESFVESIPKKTWAEWYKQKTRHLNVGKYYKTNNKIKLGVFNITHILFYLTLITTVCLSQTETVLIILGAAFGARLLTQFIVFYGAMKRLQETQLLPYFFFFDIFYFIYYIIVGFRAIFVKQNAWMY